MLMNISTGLNKMTPIGNKPSKTLNKKINDRKI